MVRRRGEHGRVVRGGRLEDANPLFFLACCRFTRSEAGQEDGAHASTGADLLLEQGKQHFRPTKQTTTSLHLILGGVEEQT